MTVSTIYSPIDECAEVLIVPERRLVYSFNRERFHTAVVYHSPISGHFNELAEFLHAQHSCKDVVIEGGRRLETFYKADALRKWQGLCHYEEELALVISDMDEARRMTMRMPELRLVKHKGYHKLNYEFHRDPDDRIMRCYNDPTTEFIRQEHGVALREAGFEYYKKEADNPVFHFDPGDIWLQAGRAHGLKHRAVEIGPGDPPRMLMVC